MKTLDHIRVDGTEHGIDFSAHYRVKGWPAISLYLLGWKADYEPVTYLGEDGNGNEIEIESGEFDPVPDYQTVVAVMVGDDKHHRVDISDLELIPEDSFCHDCGQIGCGCNVYA